MTTWLPAVMSALPRMLPVGGLFPSFSQMWIEHDGVVERLADFPGIRPTPELLLAPARIVALARRYDPATWHEDPVLAASLTRVHELESRDLRALSWDQLLDTAREAMAMPFTIMEIRRRYFPRGALALAALWLTLKILGREDRFAPLLSGVDNRTLEANRALERLAAEIRTNPALAALFASQQAETSLRHCNRSRRAAYFSNGSQPSSIPTAIARPARHCSYRNRPGKIRRKLS